MRRSILALLPFAVSLSVAACGRSGFLAEEAGGGAPLPNLPDPGDDDDDLTPTPQPPPDVGDGHDGPLTLTGALAVNGCYPVTLGTGTQLTLGSTVGLLPDRRLVVMQVQDGTSISGDATPVASASDAGQWELTRVLAVVNAVDVTLDAPLTRGYHSSATRSAQACTAPEYTTVTIEDGDTLSVLPWDGTSGGVVALFASESLRVAGTGLITASGRGLRAGPASGNGSAQDVTANDTVSNEGGRKGESLDREAFTLHGRGNRSNGGGGGNGQEAGGGGGGNGGAGGFGGSQQGDISRNLGCRGMGGSQLVFGDVPRPLLFGGGGGGGQGDQGFQGAGSDGGGVILLFVEALDGDGSILADGGTGVDSIADGAGGGGAGGTILVRTMSAGSWTGTLRAAGGGGGNYTNGTAERGTGGGGGGGRLYYQGLTLTTAGVPGGASGVNTVFGNDPYDATGGGIGTVEPY